jgi:hypothetical protein
MNNPSTTTPEKPVDEKAKPATPTHEPMKNPGQTAPHLAPQTTPDKQS